jgi:hypothetical protein
MDGQESLLPCMGQKQKHNDSNGGNVILLFHCGAGGRLQSCDIKPLGTYELRSRWVISSACFTRVECGGGNAKINLSCHSIMVAGKRDKILSQCDRQHIGSEIKIAIV